MKARSEVSGICTKVMDDLAKVRVSLDLDDDELNEALVGVEFFVAVAIRVFAATNPSKLRSASTAVSIQTLIPRPPGNDNFPN